MANFYTDNADLQYYMDKGLDWPALIAMTEQIRGVDQDAGGLEMYREILNMIGEFVAEEIAPHSEEIDREGVSLESGQVIFCDRLNEIFEKIRELGLHGMCLPEELGGMNCPMMLYMLSTELFARADVSVMAHHGFHGGMALAMLVYSVNEGTTQIDPETRQITRTRFSKEISEIVAGDAWGCMDITEPDAGSDMGALRTVATQNSDGQWHLTGQKIFITSGHGRYHFVIARTDAGDDGLEGLSLFLVETHRIEEDGTRVEFATIGRLEEKLGHHGSATVTIDFDNSPAQLVGEQGEGFKQMLLLMNNARISVGFEALGLCEAAWRLAADYAAGRPSMGKTIDRHEIIADYLEEMQTDIQGIRALAMHAGFRSELANRKRLQLKLIPPEDNDARAELEGEIRSLTWEARLLTPLLKYIAAEKSVEIARRCVQIHGGCGYMTEYGAEKLLRDAMVLPIYEGTSQIQSLMATKDSLLNIVRRPQAFLRQTSQARWQAMTATDPLEKQVARIRVMVLSAQRHLMMRVAGDKIKGKPVTSWKTALSGDWDVRTDFAPALLHAERLTMMMADAAICDLLLNQAQQDEHRRDVLVRYAERAEPRVQFLLNRIRTTGDRLLASLAEPLAAAAR